jgi:hypothetical protein
MCIATAKSVILSVAKDLLSILFSDQRFVLVPVKITNATRSSLATGHRPLTTVVSALCAALALAGCGPSRPTTVPVSGRVTLAGGTWPAAGVLYFNPVEPAAGFPRHSGMATFTRDGHFAATTWQPHDGLMPGRYKVGVECWQVTPTMGGPPEVSYVADSHTVAAQSPIELVVAPGKPQRALLWDIPQRKAR